MVPAENNSTTEYAYYNKNTNITASAWFSTEQPTRPTFMSNVKLYIIHK